MPEPPPPVEDLSTLSERYDNPTAVVPEDTVRQLLLAASSLVDFAAPFAGLSFTVDALSDTSTGLAAHTNVEQLTVAGRVDATLGCPGDGAQPNVASGSVRVVLAVGDSRLRRGFSGNIEDCQFQAASRFGETQRVRLNAAFVADLGGDVRIGSALPHALLLKLMGVTGSSSGATSSVDLAREAYELRLTTEGALETLVDSAMFGLTGLGTVVFVLNPKGQLGLRESRGSWVCGQESEPCELIR